MAGYVIYKKSRSPDTESYNGPSWDAAGIRDMRQDTYEDQAFATQIAELLSEVNPIGFSVGKQKDAA